MLSNSSTASKELTIDDFISQITDKISYIEDTLEDTNKIRVKTTRASANKPHDNESSNSEDDLANKKISESYTDDQICQSDSDDGSQYRKENTSVARRIITPLAKRIT